MARQDKPSSLISPPTRTWPSKNVNDSDSRLKKFLALGNFSLGNLGVTALKSGSALGKL
jgi:hypothetical protein